MKPFRISDVIAATGGRYFGDEARKNDVVTGVVSDSRQAGPGTLFVAFAGARVDGHNFMAQCLQKGAVCCLSEREPAPNERPCVVVDSTLRAVGRLAAWHRARFDIPVVGVTGSVGKTTTKEMLASVLSQRFSLHATEKNFNNEIGVPRTLLGLSDDHQAAVVEMGISDFGEMRRLTNMVHPTIAVMTVIGDAHLEQLGDRRGVLRAKGEIFEGMPSDGLAVLNGDDELLRAFDPGIRRVTYGLRPDCDYVASQVESRGVEGISCRIEGRGHALTADIPGFGTPMVYAALAAAAVGFELGMTPEEVRAGIAGYRTVGERARLIRTGRITILSDCYNANPVSVRAGLDSLMLMEGRKVCILGDMLELGGDSREMHRGVGRAAAEKGADLLLAAGELSADIAEGAREAGMEARWFATRDELIQALPAFIRPGDCVLVKASHSLAFEHVTEALSAL